MSHKTINTEQGHWILAKMGKRVLRPGGRLLTNTIIEELKINSTDNIVEFAPGIGFTAKLLLNKHPKTYIGIELNEEAAQKLASTIANKSARKIINTSASETSLENAVADKVIGEAMLTMQADHRKLEIIQEAHRILKKGGLYAIHELGLQPNEIQEEVKKDIQKSLAKTIRVNARPLTLEEWCDLLKKSGFRIKDVYQSPMHLLKPQRIVSDEGILRSLKIGFNIMTHPKERKRIIGMRKIFKKYDKQMTAYGIIAEKI